MSEFFVFGRANSTTFPIGTYETGLITTEGYPKFPINLIGKKSGEIDFFSDPARCLVYANDQIWVILKTLREYGATIDDSDEPRQIAEKITKNEQLVNRLTTIPKGSIGIGGMVYPNNIPSYMVIENLRIFLSYGLFLFWSLVDRHPKTIERVKRFGFRPKLFVRKETIKNIPSRNMNNVKFCQKYLEETSYSVENHEKALRYLGTKEKTEAIFYTVDGLPPTILHAPCLSWLAMGSFRAGLHASITNQIYFLDYLQSVVSFKTLTEALENYELKPLAEIYLKLAEHDKIPDSLTFTFNSFMNYFVDTVGLHHNRFCRLVRSGGIATLEDSYEAYWKLNSLSIVTHGNSLIPWEKYIELQSYCGNPRQTLLGLEAPTET